MSQLTTSRIISLLQRNCNDRESCFGCTLSGKHSLRDTCLLLELRNSLKQTQLPTVNDKQYETIHYHRPNSPEASLKETLDTILVKVKHTCDIISCHHDLSSPKQKQLWCIGCEEPHDCDNVGVVCRKYAEIMSEKYVLSCNEDNNFSDTPHCEIGE